MGQQTATAELLAPAGDLDCLRAAVHQGADAVYFGLDRGFNARARATNLGLDNLPSVMKELHQSRVKGYVTLNTLVFTPELPGFETVLRRVEESGVDAVLVQDLGVAKMVQQICPRLGLHASTQMTLTSAECISAVEHFGIERVVLPRELSIDEIRAVAAKTTVELECFVHGALCVAYSGQCLTSESLGGRSANRGQCAQACRLPYELFCDGEEVDLDRVKYLLSPQDLAAFELLPELLAAGVVSFKIEGRLKSPEYVGSVTRHYRRSLDAALAGQRPACKEEQIEEMQLTFSRGFSPGWLEGCDHKRLVPGVSSAKRGIFVGRVDTVRHGKVWVELHGRLAAGDGVMFDASLPQNEQPGGRVFQIRRGGKRIDGVCESGQFELLFRPGTLDFDVIQPGQEIWKTDDPRVTRRLRRRLAGDANRRKWPIAVEVDARVGQRLKVTVTVKVDGASDTCLTLASEAALSPARKHVITHDCLVEQFGRLGNTQYELSSVKLSTDGAPMVPLSVLGQLRKQLVTSLDEWLASECADEEEGAATDHSPDCSLTMLRASLRQEQESDGDDQVRLHIHCRTLSQLNAVIEGTRSIDLGLELSVDFADIRQYASAVELAHRNDRSLLLATPRIQKPTEMGIFHALLKHGADGYLARNLAAIRFFSERKSMVVADYCLNVANELSAGVVKELGVAWLTPSYDLNREQLLGLVAEVPSRWLEIVVHQHMPMFHMEHCVYCAVLSPGTNKTNCGRPCDDHDVQLMDRVGMKHRLTADVGCRNTLFNATPQSAAEVVPVLLDQGVRRFRVELLDQQSLSEVSRTVEAYRLLLTQRKSAVDVLSELKAMNRVGVTRGTLESARDPLAII